jgi:hypothetical protein
MTLAQDLKSLKSAYKHNAEASAAIGDTIAIIEKHLSKIVPKPKTKPPSSSPE